MKYPHRYFLSLLFFLMIPSLALAITGIPDPFLSTIETRATEDVSVMICPSCDGFPFSQARTFGGDNMDAIIEVNLLDGLGVPIANFPYEDIWVEGDDLCFVVGGHNADSSTDQNGYTEFALPKCGGGCSESPSLEGYVNGVPFSLDPVPHIKTNSPDMNCDLIVNIVDLSIFAQAYTGQYSYCADFYWDGVMDLRDLAIFSIHYHQ